MIPIFCGNKKAGRRNHGGRKPARQQGLISALDRALADARASAVAIVKVLYVYALIFSSDRSFIESIQPFLPNEFIGGK